jgi:hypothetical protein
MPSPEAPLAGSCACATVRFEITAPFRTAGYCHCHRCQRRSGVPWSMNGVVDGRDLRVLAGAASVRYWRPEGGLPKAFCAVCGGHVWSGEPGAPGVVGVRFGALLGDPEIAPQWRQWVSSAEPWQVIPDDGLPRFSERREVP